MPHVGRCHGRSRSVVRITEVRPPEVCSAQELFNELARRALPESDIEETLINEDFCFLARKASSGRSEVYQDIHELRTGRA